MLKRLLHRWEEYQKRRVAYWQLHNLTDQELNDIGISRGDIYGGIQRPYPMRLLPHLIIVILLLGWIDGGRGLKVIYYKYSTTYSHTRVT